jgi:endonuclease YncB( thermonuclease family)
MTRLDSLGAVIAVLVLLAALAYLAEPGRRLSGPVYVVDGDTLRLGGERIRLAGMDAPEMAQTCRLGGQEVACGRMAREAVIRMIGGGGIACRVTGHDKYRRDLARCEAAGQDIGGGLVCAGLAVAYGGYAAEEAEARRAGRGLWAGSFERPAAWRREHRHDGHPPIRGLAAPDDLDQNADD